VLPSASSWPGAPVPGSAPGWEPEREEARRLLQEELSRSEYAEAEPNPVLEWLGQVLGDALKWIGSLGGAAPSLPVWILPAIVMAVAVAILLLVRPRANAAARTRTAAVLSDRNITPDEHRRAANAALAAGRHGEALASWFRALVRHAEERTILDTRPGRTASDAAHALGTTIPAERPALEAAAADFNAVVYGDHDATAAQATAVRDLDARLLQAGAGSPDGVPPAGADAADAMPRPVAPR
jgi:hypothetical protein